MIYPDSRLYFLNYGPVLGTSWGSRMYVASSPTPAAWLSACWWLDKASKLVWLTSSLNPKCAATCFWTQSICTCSSCPLKYLPDLPGFSVPPAARPQAVLSTS